MLSPLKESFRYLALVRQYLQGNRQSYKITVWPATPGAHILQEFVRKYDHLISNNKQLAEMLSTLLNTMQDPLHKGKRN
jgi:hypothetical protein